jgi:hypothetical protein
MAFGKKKDEGEGIVAQLETDVIEAAASAADEVEATPADGDATADVEGAVEAAPEPAAPEAPAPAAAPAGGPDLSADLLNMFQATQIELEDRSAILELAGDVELDDLLEELQTVAAAIRVRR